MKDRMTARHRGIVDANVRVLAAADDERLPRRERNRLDAARRKEGELEACVFRGHAVSISKRAS
jgi:predicted kinase